MTKEDATFDYRPSIKWLSPALPTRSIQERVSKCIWLVFLLDNFSNEYHYYYYLTAVNSPWSSRPNDFYFNEGSIELLLLLMEGFCRIMTLKFPNWLSWLWNCLKLTNSGWLLPVSPSWRSACDVFSPNRGFCTYFASSPIRGPVLISSISRGQWVRSHCYCSD